MRPLRARIPFTCDKGQSIAEWAYHRDDPYVIWVNFGIHPTDGKPVAWQLSRDLLAEGLTHTAGEADVAMWADQHRYHVAMLTPDGAGHCQFPIDMVRAFLISAEDMVPYGNESPVIEAAIDEEWRKLSARGAR